MSIKKPSSDGGPSREKLLQIFDEHNIDADEGSTTLSRSEAIAALLTLFPNESPTKIVDRIAKLDKNNDGELTKEEFLAIGSKFFFTFEDRCRCMLAHYKPSDYHSEQMLQDILRNFYNGSWEDMLDGLIEENGDEPDRDVLLLQEEKDNARSASARSGSSSVYSEAPAPSSSKKQNVVADCYSGPVSSAGSSPVRSRRISRSGSVSSVSSVAGEEKVRDIADFEKKKRPPPPIEKGWAGKNKRHITRNFYGFSK